ncbi:hypothetical protein K1719_013131 [Acacia pycnantha]|nr:hypothetical protein K1719_013131 [Acacia pycnantha]
MDQIHLHHHHHLIPQQHHNLPQPHPLGGGITMNVDMSSGGVGGVSAAVDRLPQWSVQETKEFLRIRAELDQNFMETKRNKQLWQLISNSMADKGYFRSPEQCKCKWKNLFTRYKGCETAEPESVRQQFPFYKEIEGIFTARMQRMVWAEAEGGVKATAAAAGNVSSEDEDEDGNNNNEEISTDNRQGEMRTRKKMKRSSKSYSSSKKLKEILEEFMKQQIEIETQWMEAFREKEKERRMREMEWREAMEALENERMMMEQRWREREEERRVREEARAERRDALITSLLNKIISRPEI